MYGNICISAETLRCARKKQDNRLFMYYTLLQNILPMNQKKPDSNISLRLTMFWDRESALEQRLYRKMKKWETRHPLMGVLICTILGGILISLVAGIILNGIENRIDLSHFWRNILG